MPVRLARQPDPAAGCHRPAALPSLPRSSSPM